MTVRPVSPNPVPTAPRPPRRWGRVWATAAGLLLALGGAVYNQAEHIVLGAEAYLYGYPLVIMDITRQVSALAGAPENQLRRVREFPDARFKAVVRPNVDTLYTTAFIDADQGPWVFEMPANAERYALMPFMDAWTDVLASPGTRTTGSAPVRYLLAGPTWQGAVPDGLTLLRSPTRLVWLIGRTQTNGVADYPLVHRLQDGITLQRLDALPTPMPVPSPEKSVQALAPPLAQMQALGVQDFFTRLAGLMVHNPPKPADGPMLTKLQRLGVAPGQAPNWGPLDRAGVALGRWIADRKVAQELQSTAKLVRGWSTPPALLGQYGTAYNVRAAVAMVGLGANLPADALYPTARLDAQGQALNGSHRYRLHFATGGLPPVQAFWSVTAYGLDDFLIDNPTQRYALGDRDPLVFNADGSLDLWLQATPPAAERQRNWLPIQAGQGFVLTARLYWPRPAALDGTWGMPAVVRED